MSSSVASRSNIADPALAAEGERRIEWARRNSPVLTKLAAERLGDGTLRGRKVAVVVHPEQKAELQAPMHNAIRLGLIVQKLPCRPQQRQGVSRIDEYTPPMVETGSKNYLKIALEELASDKIKVSYRS